MLCPELLLSPILNLGRNLEIQECNLCAFRYLYSNEITSIPTGLFSGLTSLDLLFYQINLAITGILTFWYNNYHGTTNYLMLKQ